MAKSGVNTVNPSNYRIISQKPIHTVDNSLFHGKIFAHFDMLISNEIFSVSFK